MAEQKKKRLGEILMEDGLLSREHLEEALRHQKSEGGLIGQILIQLGYLTEEKLIAALGRQLKMPYLPLQNYSVNMDAVLMFDEEFCRRNNLIVIDADDNRLFIALGDPLNDRGIEEARQLGKRKPQIYITTPTEITNMLDIAFASGGGKKDVKKAG